MDCTKYFHVRPQDAGFIIGKGGRTVIKIKTDTHTRIDFDKNHPKGPCFVVQGDECHVNAAIDKLCEVAQAAFKRIPGSSPHARRPRRYCRAGAVPEWLAAIVPSHVDVVRQTAHPARTAC